MDIGGSTSEEMVKTLANKGGRVSKIDKIQVQHGKCNVIK